MTAEQAGASPLESLLSVSDLDTEIGQLQHRKAALPARRQLAEVEAGLARVERRTSEVEGARAELGSRQADLEAQIASTASRRQAIEQRLYGARHTAARDLQAMDDEVRHLQQRRTELEDEELEIMVAAEPVDAELAELAAERARLGAAADTLRADLAVEEASIDADLAARTAARTSAAGAVPPDLLARYEALRARLGGTGAARLIGSRCSGCHLELPAMEVDRIRRLPPGTVVTCEQCGRILVPVSH